ncbi:hypothetical protein E2C01_039653 [Portunus trituberculatus]|uniref:Uncharacterized protein n=1 Tax=Portunus trituberculatus TaxID=210409 RepID=A0A5B7FKC4_PORTR|nr:hypothetical protein [Portunus trituberculatus]
MACPAECLHRPISTYHLSSDSCVVPVEASLGAHPFVRYVVQWTQRHAGVILKGQKMRGIRDWRDPDDIERAGLPVPPSTLSPIISPQVIAIVCDAYNCGASVKGVVVVLRVPHGVLAA